MKLAKFAKVFSVCGGDVMANLECQAEDGSCGVRLAFIIDSIMYRVMLATKDRESSCAIFNSLNAETLTEIVTKAIKAQNLALSPNQPNNEPMTYTCLADANFILDEAANESKHCREEYASKVNLSEHVEDLIGMLRKNGLDGLNLEVKKTFDKVHKRDGGWRDCYASFFIQPDLDKCNKALPEIEEFYANIKEWVARRVPSGIAVQVHVPTGQVEIFDPIRLQQECKA